MSGVTLTEAFQDFHGGIEKFTSIAFFPTVLGNESLGIFAWIWSTFSVCGQQWKWGDCSADPPMSAGGATVIGEGGVCDPPRDSDPF